MTTNALPSVPIPPADRPQRKSLWLPRSPEAFGLLALTVAGAAWPFVLAGFWSWVSATGCFFDCTDPDPLLAAALAALAAAILVSPLVAVRFYQSQVGTIGVRLVTILVVDLAAIGFSVWWLRP
jgi:hypothetical protein